MKKVRQQLNALTDANQAGGGTVPVAPAKPIPPPVGPTAVTPPPTNVPRKAQVGQPTMVAKPKAPPQAMAPGPKKPTPPKPQ